MSERDFLAVARRLGRIAHNAGEALRQGGIGTREAASWINDIEIEAAALVKEQSGREEPAPVARIAEDVASQDGAATSHPIFVVEKRRRIHGLSNDYAESFVWFAGEDGEVGDDLAEALEVAYAARGIVPAGYSRVGYVDVWVFATACLTRAGCEAYLRENGHNLHSPRIYVYSGYRNLEWAQVREFMMGIWAECAKAGNASAERRSAGPLPGNAKDDLAHRIADHVRQLGCRCDQAIHDRAPDLHLDRCPVRIAESIVFKFGRRTT